MNKLNSLFKALILAWYSPQFYTEVYQDWRGRIFALLALLCLLTGTAYFIKPLNAIHEWHLAYNKKTNPLPSLQFDNHCLLTINAPSPYRIQSLSTGKLLLIFDTTADQQTLAAYPALLLSFGRNGFYIHHGAPQAKPLSQFVAYQAIAPLVRTLTFTPKQGLRALNNLMITIQLILYGFSVLALFATKAVTALFAALIAIPIAFFYRLPLSLSQAFRIGVLALIPATLLEYLYNCFSLPEVTGFNLALSILSLSYLIRIIRHVKMFCAPMQNG